MSYFSIDKEVIVGNYILKKGISLEICSSALLSTDWCIVLLTDQMNDKISFERLAKSKVFIGYENEPEEVFNGYLSKQNANSLTLKDDTVFLEETMISKSFVNATFQEAVSYCLGKSGIVNFKITGKRMTSKSFTISKKNALSAIKEIKQIWHVDDPHFFIKNTFYLGVEVKQNKVYKFTYGINILSLERYENVWKMILPALPYLRHTNRFVLDHPKISGTFVTLKVVHKVDETGFTRTVVEFKE